VSAGIRVVVVEDSPTQLALLTRVLAADGDIAVVGQALDAHQAIEEVRRLRPDVVTMDLRIPGGGGQLAIETIMASDPTPILVLSAAIEGPGSAAAFEAMAAGAVDVAAKPARWTPEDEHHLRARVRVLRGVRVVRHMRHELVRPPSSSQAAGEPVVALAASTGGPAAVAEVLRGLAGLPAPVLVVQHLDAEFLPGFAAWLERESRMAARVASAGQRLEPGVAIVGPGGTHLRVDADRRVELALDPLSLHRPSADELFRSLARHVGAATVAVVLSGMGEDGAEGLGLVRDAGGTTIAQDEATSTVYGMPRAAAERGAAGRVAALDRIPALVRAAVERRGR
jgi:two-component system chemotaxis response regulator CheB